ncbi:MAG TPA: hypothetical protein VJ723_09335, partial [Candidatus Angelobacter sp.]|nr:hypothetical protein [Candidatus Angelobacter sp.]
IARALVLVIFIPLVIPLAIIGIVSFLVYRTVLYLLIWLVWLPRGKDVLYVSSDSPIWQQYMADQILPLVKNRAVVLNWSEREKWFRYSFSVRVFRAFGGSREFNPLVVVFRPLRRARCFRFLPAFKDWKHGNTGSVEQLRRELMSSL